MPIRAENKARYPKDWAEISARIRARAKNKCEECGIENYKLGGRTPDGRFFEALPTVDNGLRLTWPQPGEMASCEGSKHKLRVIRIVLTVAHLDHQPENCADDNLKALCQRCHNRYDRAARVAGVKARRRQACAIGDFFEEQAR